MVDAICKRKRLEGWGSFKAGELAVFIISD